MRKKGPVDITYCNTFCMQENCKRNLKFFQPPTKYYSVSSFNADNEDPIHTKCANKLIKEN